MQNRTKTLATMAKAAGLEVTAYYQKNNRHCVDARAPNGLTATFSLTNKPGDLRGDINEQSRIRRFARINTPTETPMATITKTDLLKTASKPASDEPATGLAEMSAREAFRLFEFLRTNDPGAVASREALSMLATQRLDFTVSEYAISEAMMAADIPEPDAWKPPADPIQVLARELAAMQEQLGVVPSVAFKRLIKS